jgi:hypothetical protein
MQVPLVDHQPPACPLGLDLERLDPEVAGKGAGEAPAQFLDGDTWILRSLGDDAAGYLDGQLVRRRDAVAPHAEVAERLVALANRLLEA